MTINSGTGSRKGRIPCEPRASAIMKIQVSPMASTKNEVSGYLWTSDSFSCAAGLVIVDTVNTPFENAMGRKVSQGNMSLFPGRERRLQQVHQAGGGDLSCRSFFHWYTLILPYS